MRDFIFSRYNNVDSVFNLDFNDFIEMYIKGLNNVRAERLWLAWVMWQPDMGFNEFLENQGVVNNSENKKESGLYIDQIGM